MENKYQIFINYISIYNKHIFLINIIKSIYIQYYVFIQIIK